MAEYISREAVLTVLDWDCASQDALNAIKALPAADVAPVRHGRWEQVGSIIPLYECDQCHAFALGGNFCSSCGATMYGGKGNG